MYGNFFSRSTPAPASDNCQSLQPLLSLFADGMASRSERAQVQAHLNCCADCRAALNWMQATHDVLAARETAPPPPTLAARCRRAWAAEEALTPLPRAVPAHVRGWRPAFAVALSVAAGAFVYAHFNPAPGTVKPVPIAVQPNQGVVPIPVTPVKQPALQKTAVQPHRELPIAVPKTIAPYAAEQIAVVPKAVKPFVQTKLRPQTQNLVAVKAATPKFDVKTAPTMKIATLTPKSGVLAPKLVPPVKNDAPQIATDTPDSPTPAPPAATIVVSLPKNDVPTPQTAQYTVPAHSDPMGAVRVRLASVNSAPTARKLALIGAVHVQASFVQSAITYTPR